MHTENTILYQTTLNRLIDIHFKSDPSINNLQRNPYFSFEIQI